MCTSQVCDRSTLTPDLLTLFSPAYTGDQSGSDAIKANVEILQNAVEAVEHLCPKLKVWIFQTGGKVCSVPITSKQVRI
jgi:hypothetical protein